MNCSIESCLFISFLFALLTLCVSKADVVCAKARCVSAGLTLYAKALVVSIIQPAKVRKIFKLHKEKVEYFSKTIDFISLVSTKNSLVLL